MSAGNRDAEYFGEGGGGGMADFPTSGGGRSGPLDLRYGGGGVSGGGGQPIQGGDQMSPKQLQKYKFTPDEMKAIRDCNRESFYFRCLPIGTLLGCGTYYAVRYGYLKPSPRFGAGPKMFFASIVGYFVGKISYQSVCAEKLMALPNSQLGEMLKKQKGRLGFQETLSMEPGFATVAPVGAPAFPNSDLGHGSYSDVGDVRPMSGFDSEGGSSLSGYDLSQPSSGYDTTHQMLDDDNLPPKRPQYSTTYDDLRRQNRIDYESRQHGRPAPPPQPIAPPIQRGGGDSGGYYDSRKNQPSNYPSNDGYSKPKNKYGDVWDEKPGSY